MFDATQAIGEARVEQRLEVRALAGDEDADHAATIRPITWPPRPGDDGAVADPEVEDAPQLVLVDVPGEPVEDGRALPGPPVDLGAQAVGDDARQVALDPAARDVREAVGVASARTSSR